ncbi:hypothetical protein AU184_26285 [Mycolicibacterium novocastrense]|uniref:HNH endonuclease signature motif containing protein n=1 Tax=Mycolicibacterium novocastrense TaxID=59813 RepID=UPI0007471097|nr:HNH endonuclease signature motif containing protein [Mycolicibacterium novocastrense]KUH71192.1 hypothetical protein AU183_19935 [Mycolicibacterium novocastrense]KUH73372.1 hypothetical protein AU184_26285 [Mycolicibacterium novocastrense]
MSIASADAQVDVGPHERLVGLLEQLAELSGQRNAIDGRIVEIIAEIDRDGLWSTAEGVRSVKALVAWKLGMADATAKNVAAIAQRFDEFPRCTSQMRQGRLSLDQVGVIAQYAGAGSDEHYAQMASVATVNQLRFAIKLEPRPQPDHRDPPRGISKTVGEQATTYRITLPHLEAAALEAALQSHRDALIGEHTADHGPDTGADTHERRQLGDLRCRPPFPTLADAFMRMVHSAWDTEVARRPHDQHTTAIVHLDLDKPAAWPHLGPVLCEAERRMLLCDTTCQVWLERHGQLIGSGRSTRVISRRLRRALEHRDRTCQVPGCWATRGLHAHHIVHWEDGGPTELHNLVLVCPYHHRMHHRGQIIITGPADQLLVTGSDGQPLDPGSLAHPPTQPPPTVPPCPGPRGERAEWKWYDPYEPQPPPSDN